VLKAELTRLLEHNKKLEADFTPMNNKYVYSNHLLKIRNAELQNECQQRKLAEMCAVYGIKAVREMSREMEKVKDELAKTRLQFKLTTMKYDMNISNIWGNKIHQNRHSGLVLESLESKAYAESGSFGSSFSSLQGIKYLLFYFHLVSISFKGFINPK
jgi:hypothetical protein